MAYHVVRSGYSQLVECSNHYSQGTNVQKWVNLIRNCRCRCSEAMTPVLKNGPQHPRKILSSGQIQSRYLNRLLNHYKN